MHDTPRPPLCKIKNCSHQKSRSQIAVSCYVTFIRITNKVELSWYKYRQKNGKILCEILILKILLKENVTVKLHELLENHALQYTKQLTDSNMKTELQKPLFVPSTPISSNQEAIF